MKFLFIRLKWFSVFFVALFFINKLMAQEANFNYCQKVAPWEDFVIDSTIEKEQANILIVTNRPYQVKEKEFLPNAIADWRKVTYFLAYCHSDKWHLSLVDSITTGLNAIDNGGDFLLYVHGHGKTFPEALSRTAQVQQRYNINIIMFDWPSENSNFHTSLARVRRCGENFYNLTLQLRDYRKEFMSKEQHLSIMANSLGNYFLADVVGNGNNQYYTEKFVDNIILNAAAIKSGSHAGVVSQIKISDRIYVALNKNDRVLRGAHILTSGKMLGNYAEPPLAYNAEYIHFTSIADKQHNYFSGYYQFEYDNPIPFGFYNTILHGGEVDLENENYFKSRVDGNGYDIIDLKSEIISSFTK